MKSVPKNAPEGPKPPSRRGRPKVCNNDLVAKALNLYLVERMSLRDVARVLGVSHMTIYRLLNDENLQLLLN